MVKVVLLFRGGLGDGIVLQPAIAELRTSLPSNNIVLIGNPAAASVLHSFGLVDEFITLDEEPWWSFCKGGGQDHKCWEIIDSADLVISWLADQNGTLLKKMVDRGRIHIHLGCVWKAGEQPGFLQDDLSEIRPVSSWFAAYLQPLGIKRDVSDPELIPSSSAYVEAKNIMCGCHGPWYTIHPGASCPDKCWPIECWAQVVKIIQARTNYLALILLGPNEMESMAYIQSSFKDLQHRIIADVKLSVMGALIADGKVHLGNDTGPSHLAAAVGGPVVAIFNEQSDPSLWAPQGNRVSVVHAARGLSNLSPNQVLSAVFEQINY